jgi:hypothetical protein
MDEESTGGVIIPSAIARSWKRNSYGEFLFRREGKTTSGTRNPPEVWDSTENDQLIDEEST